MYICPLEISGGHRFYIPIEMTTDKPFVVAESKNCCNWLKLMYEVQKPVDADLIHKLKIFGKVKYMDFSQFSAKGSLYFSIQNFEDQIKIEGCVGKQSLYFTCPRRLEAQQKTFEDILTEWAFEV